MTIPIPFDVGYGFVTGRFVHVGADGPADLDRFPDGRAAVGRVRFTPSERVRRTSNYSAFAIYDEVLLGLDGLGRIVDAQTDLAIQDGTISGFEESGPHGVFLAAGEWTVTPQLEGVTFTPFTIFVTVVHTLASPLDIRRQVPLSAPTASTVWVGLAPPPQDRGYRWWLHADPEPVEPGTDSGTGDLYYYEGGA